MAAQDSPGRAWMGEQLETYRDFTVVIRYVIAAHVAAGALAIMWLSGASLLMSTLGAIVVMLAGIYVVRRSSRHLSTDEMRMAYNISREGRAARAPHPDEAAR